MPDSRVRCGSVWDTPFAGQVDIPVEFHVVSVPADEPWPGSPGTELRREIDDYKRSLIGRITSVICNYLRKHCD